MSIDTTDNQQDLNNPTTHEQAYVNEPVREVQTESSALKSQVLERLSDYLLYLLPQGKIKKRQFIVGNIYGHRGQSLRVELFGARKGLWKDFESNEGGDIFDLWAAVYGQDTHTHFPEILDAIQGWLEGTPSDRSKSTAIVKPKLSKPKKGGGGSLNLGEPSIVWTYVDAYSTPVTEIRRYDDGDNKTYRPWDCKTKTFCMPDADRPLYNLPTILKAGQVVLVEGESSAEALISQGIVATTAMGGAHTALEKTDWSPLKGKHIVMWPDNDMPGKDYAQRLQSWLQDIGVASFQVLAIPEDMPEKWDAADALDEELDFESFIKEQATTPPPCVTPDRPLPQTETSKAPQIEEPLPPVLRDAMRQQKTPFRHILPPLWEGLPPPREWVVPEWMPKGYVTALYGDGGTGKSLLAQQIMTMLATGRPWFDQGVCLPPMKVYGLFCEDDENELWRRQHAINQQFNIPMSDLHNMRLVSRVGCDNFLMTFDGKDTGRFTCSFADLVEDLNQFKPDLVVLDTAADLFGGNENNRAHVRQFVQNCCARIARQNNGAVLLCAHPSDAGLQRKTGTGGSTAWNNTVRSRWYLTRPDEDPGVSAETRILSRKKANYAAASSEITLNWHQGAFICIEQDPEARRLAHARPGRKNDAERSRKNKILLDLIASEARKGKLYTTTKFCKAFDGQKGLGSWHTIRDRLDTLIATGHVKFAKEEGTKTKTKYGVLCVKDMKVLRVVTDPITGKKSKRFKLLLPTHYQTSTEELEPVVDPHVWEISEDLNEIIEFAHDDCAE